MLDSDPDFDNVSVIGSQLVTVNISQASAKQRAGRAGRVSAGTCYRLYTLDDLESKFDEFAIPEMLRMELSQLVLHSISFYHSISGHPLSLLLDSPDPPSESRLRQALYELAFQGLVDITSADESSHFQSSVVENLTKPIQLTPLGIAVCNMQVSPILGRMLFLGLVLRAIGPALSIAALLSVPQVFSNSPGSTSKNNNLYCSDVVFQLSEYEKFKEAQQRRGAYHPKSALYNQVTRIRGQLEQALTKFMGVDGSQGTDWNENGNRVAAQVGLICAATPNIAHLVSGRSGFSTRNVISTARMHPSSVNFDNDRRAHWYVYHELRATSEAYLQVTTAVSPLDLAIFASASSTQNPGTVAINVYSDLGDMGKNADWLFIADQWVPVAVLASSQSNAFRLLRRWITYEMLQQVALDASKFSQNEDYNQIVLFTLSALEQQRLPK